MAEPRPRTYYTTMLKERHRAERAEEHAAAFKRRWADERARAEAAEAEVRALREALAAYQEFVAAHLAVEGLIADHTDDRDAYNAAVERADRALAAVAATADPTPDPETP